MMPTNLGVARDMALATPSEDNDWMNVKNGYLCCSAIRDATHDIISSGNINHGTLADRLLSKGVINQSTYDTVTSRCTGMDESERLRLLLQETNKSIEREPKHFKTFLTEIAEEGGAIVGNGILTKIQKSLQVRAAYKAHALGVAY